MLARLAPHLGAVEQAEDAAQRAALPALAAEEQLSAIDSAGDSARFW